MDSIGNKDRLLCFYYAVTFLQSTIVLISSIYIVIHIIFKWFQVLVCDSMPMTIPSWKPHGAKASKATGIGNGQNKTFLKGEVLQKYNYQPVFAIISAIKSYSSCDKSKELALLLGLSAFW